MNYAGGMAFCIVVLDGVVQRLCMSKVFEMISEVHFSQRQIIFLWHDSPVQPAHLFSPPITKRQSWRETANDQLNQKVKLADF